MSSSSSSDSSSAPPSAQQAQILASAITILGERGAAALTIRNVAKGAGCSTTGVYTYFGGKQGLVDAIFVEGFESFDAAMDAAEEAAGLDDVRAFGLAYRRWALDRPTHYQVMFGRAVPEYEPSVDALVRAGQSFDCLVDRVSAGGSTAGLGARALAMHVWATVHGYVMLELAGMMPHDVGDPGELYAAGLDRLGSEIMRN